MLHISVWLRAVRIRVLEEEENILCLGSLARITSSCAACTAATACPFTRLLLCIDMTASSCCSCDACVGVSAIGKLQKSERDKPQRGGTNQLQHW